VEQRVAVFVLRCFPRGLRNEVRATLHTEQRITAKSTTRQQSGPSKNLFSLTAHKKAGLLPPGKTLRHLQAWRAACPARHKKSGWRKTPNRWKLQAA